MGLPLAGYAVVREAEIISEALSKMSSLVVDRVEPRSERMRELAERSQALITLVAPIIGYERAAEVSRMIYAGKGVREALIVIRAEEGRVEESLVFDARLEETVKDIAKHAMEEWDPSRSDFIVVKDNLEVTVTGELVEEVAAELEEQGRIVRSESGVKALIPVYYISFDTEMVDDDNYIDRKIYLIAPLVYSGLKDELEAHAAQLTSPPSREAAGIRK